MIGGPRSMRHHLSLLLAGMLLAVGAARADAQTIRPLVAEFQTAARGKVELVNEGDRPLTVVVELKGFSVDEGGTVHDEPLPTDLRVKLSATSLRIPPRQSRFVFYEATSSRHTSWFSIVARFSGYSRTQLSGVDVQLELPHFVYLLPRNGLAAEELRVAEWAFDAHARHVTVVVENRGEHFGRPVELELLGANSRTKTRGFPLLPGGRRRVEFEWSGDEPPRRIVIRGRGLTFESELPPGS